MKNEISREWRLVVILRKYSILIFGVFLFVGVPGKNYAQFTTPQQIRNTAKNSQRATLDLSIGDFIEKFNQMSKTADLDLKVPQSNKFERSDINSSTIRLMHKLNTHMAIIIDMDKISNGLVAAAIMTTNDGSMDKSIRSIGGLAILSTTIYGPRSKNADAVIKLCNQADPKKPAPSPSAKIGKFDVTCGIGDGLAMLSISAI